MTDTDQLSTPADMVALLKRLTKVMRDVEALPDNAQQRFWDDTSRGLESTPVDELRLDTVSMRSTTVFHSILVNMCGPRLAEMVNGATKEYYESLISQMKEMAVRPPSDWDNFINEKFEASKGTDHDGLITASVSLHTLGGIGHGIVTRVKGASKILKLIVAGRTDDTERHFSSKDIILMDMAQSTSESCSK